MNQITEKAIFSPVRQEFLKIFEPSHHARHRLPNEWYSEWVVIFVLVQRLKWRLENGV